MADQNQKLTVQINDEKSLVENLEEGVKSGGRGLFALLFNKKRDELARAIIRHIPNAYDPRGDMIFEALPWAAVVLRTILPGSGLIGDFKEMTQDLAQAIVDVRKEDAPNERTSPTQSNTDKAVNAVMEMTGAQVFAKLYAELLELGEPDRDSFMAWYISLNEAPDSSKRLANLRKMVASMDSAKLRAFVQQPAVKLNQTLDAMPKEPVSTKWDIFTLRAAIAADADLQDKVEGFFAYVQLQKPESMVAIRERFWIEALARTHNLDEFKEVMSWPHEEIVRFFKLVLLHQSPKEWLTKFFQPLEETPATATVPVPIPVEPSIASFSEGGKRFRNERWAKLRNRF
jgi:hypothetical protein